MPFRLWMQGPKCRSNARLDGKVVVITGANTGIGKVTALELSKRGAKVVMLCRSLERGQAAADQIRKVTQGEVILYQMDLSSQRSIRECAQQLSTTLEKIDILVNNAGVANCPLQRTEDGLEMQMGTNHFGHFLLTHLLMPLLRKAAPGARIVNVSSLGHIVGQIYWDDINFETRPYSPLNAYTQSKLANILFTKELARRMEGSGVTAYALHPGVINTEVGRHIKDSYGALAALLYKPFNALGICCNVSFVFVQVDYTITTTFFNLTSTKLITQQR